MGEACPTFEALAAMLILRWHRPLNRANFPIAAAMLVLFNVFTFFGCQVDNDAALAAAQDHHVQRPGAVGTAGLT